jgi:hypothetical protein
MQRLWGAPPHRPVAPALARAGRGAAGTRPRHSRCRARGDAGAPRRRGSRRPPPRTNSASATTSWRRSTPSAIRPPPPGPTCTSAPPARSSQTTPTCSSCATASGSCSGVSRGARGAGAAFARTTRRNALPRLHPFPAGPAHDGRQARHALGAGFRARYRGPLCIASTPSASTAARARPARRPRSSSCSAATRPKVLALDRLVTERMGFRRAFPVTGQTYPRKTDSAVLDVLSGIAQSAAKLAGDLRLLQHEGELLEPFEAEQIGSSAMAYKRNPMRAERIGALARFVMSLQANGAHTAAAQWLERTLDDSANRRLSPAGGVPRHRRDSHPGREHRQRARGPRGRDPCAGASRRCRSWPPSDG